MKEYEPLEEWLWATKGPGPGDAGAASSARASMVAAQRIEIHAGLERLEQLLDTPAPDRRTLADVRLDQYGALGFDRADLPRAQALYRRVFTAGGRGNTHVQESLLELIARACDPASTLFWSEALDLVGPRDTFGAQRRTMTLAALALLAIRHDTPEAHAALRQAAHHTRADVRALAVYYLSQVYLHDDHPFPSDVQSIVNDIAAHDAAFEPRFLARAMLRAAHLPVPMDNPGGVYAFQIMPAWDTTTRRTIELQSEQTLDTLHAAIQRSIQWDSDHLYSFFMNGILYDQRYGFACPMEDDHPPWTDEAILGELGLALRHTFLYLFDYGDDNQFDIEVVGVYPHIQSGATYPRVVASQGQAPSQYGDGGEPDQEEWDGDEHWSD